MLVRDKYGNVLSDEEIWDMSMTDIEEKGIHGYEEEGEIDGYLI